MTQPDEKFRREHYAGLIKAFSAENTNDQLHIRPTCFLPYAEGWEQPSGTEVREILRKANLTGAAAAKLVGISESRTVRRWTGDASDIPYAVWAILCHAAGLGIIWIPALEAPETK